MDLIDEAPKSGTQDGFDCGAPKSGTFMTPAEHGALAD